MAAEQRRRRKRNPPATVDARDRPLDTEAGKGLPLPKDARQRVAAVQTTPTKERLNGFAALGRVGPYSSDEHRMRLAEAALSHRASTGIGNSARRRSRRMPRSPGRLASSRGAARISEARAARRCSAPKAGTDASSQLTPPGASTRVQRKLTPDRPLVDNDAQLLEARFANGKRRRQVTQTSRRWALASRQPSFESFGVLGFEQGEKGRACADDKTSGGYDRDPRLFVQPLSRGDIQVERANGLFA